jgi:hypothetical protein
MALNAKVFSHQVYKLGHLPILENTLITLEQWDYAIKLFTAVTIDVSE